MTKSVYCVGMGLLIAGSAAGCAVAMDEGETGEATATRGEAVIDPIGGSSAWYSWASGDSTVQMTPTGTSACFLTEIHGRFQGTGDRVRITTGSQNWQLTGSGASTGVKARCISLPASQVSGWTHTWAAGDPSQDLGTSTNRVCFLVDIYGAYRSDDDFVATRIHSDHWYLEGGTQSGGGAARCISGTNFVAKAGVTSGQNVDFVLESGTAACFMTQLGGNLYGIPVTYPPSIIPSTWVGDANLVVVQRDRFLWNLSSGFGSATARCIP